MVFFSFTEYAGTGLMRTIIVWVCLLAVLIDPCMSDMYMHFPHGSNNRLNGNQDNVKNANRLFDSQVGRLSIYDFLIGPFVFGEVKDQTRASVSPLTDEKSGNYS